MVYPGWMPGTRSGAGIVVRSRVSVRERYMPLLG